MKGVDKLAVCLAVVCIFGITVTGAIVAKSSATHNSIVDCAKHQHMPTPEATDGENLHQFSAKCLSKSGMWYDVYYEATEPDFSREVELCELNLVP